MPDALSLRTVLILSLSLPILTFLACGSDSASRVAQIHPAVLAGTQLLASLTAMMAGERERS